MSEETIAYERYLVYTFLAGIHASVGVSLLSLSLFADSLYLSHSCARSNNFLLQCGVFVKKNFFLVFFIFFFNVNQFFSFDFFLSDQFYFVAVSDQTWFWFFPSHDSRYISVCLSCISCGF